jgi:hypothetical protein
MKNTEVNYKLFEDIFINKDRDLFKTLKNMNSFSIAMAKVRFEAFDLVKSKGFTTLEEDYISEIGDDIEAFNKEYHAKAKARIKKYGKLEKDKYEKSLERGKAYYPVWNDKRKKAIASEIRPYIQAFFRNQERNENYNLHMVKANLRTGKKGKGWYLNNHLGKKSSGIDFDNPEKNKLFLNEYDTETNSFLEGKEVDKSLIKRLFDLAKEKNTGALNPSIRILELNFGVSAEDSIPVKFFLHFINKSLPLVKKFNLETERLWSPNSPVAGVITKNDYKEGDWTRWITEHNREEFELDNIPRFWDYYKPEQIEASNEEK